MRQGANDGIYENLCLARDGFTSCLRLEDVTELEDAAQRYWICLHAARSLA